MSLSIYEDVRAIMKQRLAEVRTFYCASCVQSRSANMPRQILGLCSLYAEHQKLKTITTNHVSAGIAS
jgi:hypothetical protein